MYNFLINEHQFILHTKFKCVLKLCPNLLKDQLIVSMPTMPLVSYAQVQLLSILCHALLTTCILIVFVIIRYYKRKAEETCTALLDAIAPHQGQRLKRIVLPSSESSDDDLFNVVGEMYHNIKDANLKCQLLSLIVHSQVF